LENGNQAVKCVIKTKINLKDMEKNQTKILQLCTVLLFLLPFTSWGQIKVYTMDGCGRCSWTVNYLKENKIPFTELNTTKDEKNNQEMWDLLSRNGGGGTSITMPVVDNNGKVAYSIPDLEEYVGKLNTKDNTNMNNSSSTTTTKPKPEIVEEKKPTKKKKIIPSKLKKNG